MLYIVYSLFHLIDFCRFVDQPKLGRLETFYATLNHLLSMRVKLELKQLHYINKNCKVPFITEKGHIGGERYEARL